MKYPIRDSNPYPIREDEGESLFNVPPIPRANCSTRRASCSDNGDIGCRFLQVVDTTTASFTAYCQGSQASAFSFVRAKLEYIFLPPRIGDSPSSRASGQKLASQAGLEPASVYKERVAHVRTFIPSRAQGSVPDLINVLRHRGTS